MTMLTPKQIEVAARELCDRRGVDPDYVIPRPAFFRPGAPAFPERPVWKAVADEIREHMELQDVIDFAKEREPA